MSLTYSRKSSGKLHSLQTFVLEILTNQSDDVLVRLAQGNRWRAHFTITDDVSVSVLGGPISCGPVLHAPVISSLHGAAAAATTAVYTSGGTVSSGFFTRRLSTVVPR